MKKLFLAGLVMLPAIVRAEIPTRKPGLWEITIRSEKTVQTIKHCTDPEVDKALMSTDKSGVQAG